MPLWPVKPSTDENTDVMWSFDIGSSDCKTNRLVSLTETVQFSMICQGTRSVNVLANGYYMRFADFVNSYQTINLKFLALRSQRFIRQPWNWILVSMKSGVIIPQDVSKYYIWNL